MKQGAFDDACRHHWLIEEARGRLRVPGVCNAYWDETPGGYNQKNVKRSYGTDPLAKMRVKW